MVRLRIEIRHLQAFVEVCAQRHFTRAAQSLAMSQPALSTLIAQLEEDLGTQLLLRTTRSVEITPAGRDFLVSATRIVGDFQRSIEDLHDYSQFRKGRLRIAALPSLCAVILPQVAKTFARRFGGIKTTIVDLPGDMVVEQVIRREVDFGIGYVTSGDMVVAEPILTDRLVAVAAPSVFAEERTHRWADLHDRELVAMSEGTTIRRLMEEAFRTAGVEPRIVLEANQMPTALSYASAGLGVAILPSSGVPHDPEGTVQIDLIDPVVERSLSVIRARDNPISPPAAAFLELLRLQCEATAAFDA